MSYDEHKEARLALGEARAEIETWVKVASDLEDWRLYEVARAEAAEAEVARLHKLLSEHAADALEDVHHWSSYASDYFRDKHDVEADVAKWERRRDLNAGLS